MAANQREMTMAEMLDSTFTGKMNALVGQNERAQQQQQTPAAAPMPQQEDPMVRALRQIMGAFGQSPVAPMSAPMPQPRPAPGPIQRPVPGVHVAPPPLFSTRTG